MTTAQEPLAFHHQFIAPTEGKGYTFLLLHGTGGNEYDMIPIGEELAPGSAYLSPRGQVIENGMPRFFRRFAEGVFDVEDIVRRAGQLADFLKSSAEKYDFDPAKVVPVGYSNGANIAVAMLLLETHHFPAAVLLRPMVPLSPDRTPDLSATSIFIAAGRQDPIVPAENTQELVCLFKQAQAKVTARTAEASHALLPHELHDARVWLVEHGLA